MLASSIVCHPQSPSAADHVNVYSLCFMPCVYTLQMGGAQALDSAMAAAAAATNAAAAVRRDFRAASTPSWPPSSADSLAVMQLAALQQVGLGLLGLEGCRLRARSRDRGHRLKFAVKMSTSREGREPCPHSRRECWSVGVRVKLRVRGCQATLVARLERVQNCCV